MIVFPYLTEYFDQERSQSPVISGVIKNIMTIIVIQVTDMWKDIFVCVTVKIFKVDRVIIHGDIIGFGKLSIITDIINEVTNGYLVTHYPICVELCIYCVNIEVFKVDSISNIGV